MHAPRAWLFYAPRLLGELGTARSTLT